MFGKQKKDLDSPDGQVSFSVAWGGYYSAQDESGEWGVFRLLDFNRDAYHATLFKERFASPPSLEEAQALQPFARHAPIAAGQLVNFPATLIGESTLTLDDLNGYDAYLEYGSGLEEDERLAFLQKIVGFSNKPTLSFNMSLDDNGVLVISEA